MSQVMADSYMRMSVVCNCAWCYRLTSAAFMVWCCMRYRESSRSGFKNSVKIRKDGSCRKPAFQSVLKCVYTVTRTGTALLSLRFIDAAYDEVPAQDSVCPASEPQTLLSN